ncbi:MAG: hypothetical protein FWF96_07860, partial [Kiritimatiellaeota bacterium]|nr:hypothetical protein [Kiritimatiellota bacterium]
MTPQPDFTQFQKVLTGEKPDRPVLFELYFNQRLDNRVAGPEAPGATALERHARKLKIFRNLGYDYALTFDTGLNFPANNPHHGAQTISLNEGAVIFDRASFDAYPWPDPDADVDPAPFGDALLPALHGAKMVPGLPGGPFENVIKLVGYDALCFMLADDPALASDIFEAVGSRLARMVERLAPMPCVGAIMANDDWGFRTQTLLSLEHMRKYVFPWHRRITAAAHNAGKPVLLHSCGYAGEVMPDIIHDMKFDA